MYTQYLGAMPAELDAVLPRLTEDSFPGILVNVIAGRIANRLGLGGVNYSVDSACASSLTAVELAVKELRSGSSDMVLAGGADFHNSINDFMMFTSVGALSAQGRCRSFDNNADGTNGSVNQFYSRQSNGRVNLTFEVASVDLPHPHAYYDNDFQRVPPWDGGQALVHDALAALQACGEAAATRITSRILGGIGGITGLRASAGIRARSRAKSMAWRREASCSADLATL